MPEVENKREKFINYCSPQDTHNTHPHTKKQEKKEDITRTINNCGINRKFFFFLHLIKPLGLML